MDLLALEEQRRAERQAAHNAVLAAALAWWERKRPCKFEGDGYTQGMEFGIAILFGIGALWMFLTTPEQRQMILL